MKHPRTIRRGLGLVAVTAALAAVPVFGTSAIAGAADSGQGSASSGRRAHTPLTQEQRQCLADQGVTLPEKPADGSRPQLSQEQRDALRAAAETCGLQLGRPHGGRPQLTQEQRQCLADQGVTRPEKPADGSRPQLSQEQRDARRAAAEKCGIELPGARGPGAGASGGGSATSA